MEEALDTEVGRFLVTIGLASRAPNGQLIYQPQKTNTYVIFVTDNGSNGTWLSCRSTPPARNPRFIKPVYGFLESSQVRE